MIRCLPAPAPRGASGTLHLTFPPDAGTALNGILEARRGLLTLLAVPRSRQPPRQQSG